MYNRYQGNSGRVQRLSEPSKTKPSKPMPESPIAQKPKANPPPLKSLGKAKNPLEVLLPKGMPELETEDLILLLILYLMYRESGDSDLLIMMGAMFLL